MEGSFMLLTVGFDPPLKLLLDESNVKSASEFLSLAAYTQIFVRDVPR